MDSLHVFLPVQAYLIYGTVSGLNDRYGVNSTSSGSVKK